MQELPTQPAASNTDRAIAAVADRLRNGLRQVGGRGRLLNEATTLDLLIKPTLEALGYPPEYRIPEHGEQRNRLDDSCYLKPVTDSPGYAALIVEAKQLGVNFDHHTPGQGRADSPDRQIKRYLERHSASGPNTLGVLTDGAKWRIYRRAGSLANPDIELVAEYDFQPLADAGAALPGLAPDLRERLAALVQHLSWEQINYRTTTPFLSAPPVSRADRLFSALADDFQPDNVLRQLLNDPDLQIQDSLAGAVNLQGKQYDAHGKDWQAYAYVAGVPLQADNPSLLEHRVVVAAVQFRHGENLRLARPDAALAARAFADADLSKVAVLLAYTAAPDGAMEARLVVAANGQVNMTAAFDPTLPAPSARAATEQLLQLLQQPGAGLTIDKLTAPLEAAPLRQQFYREVAQWTGRQQKGQQRPRRQAILRHLVRVMFAWILKEENLIPAELFEEAFVAANLTGGASYHRDLLRFLFHQRLNVPEEQREAHPNAAIDQSMDGVPFLNGSLFAVHPDDDTLDIPAADYWNVDADRTGLFTILSRYHWTMDEHRPGESEQTLDPELLSNLFERLIAPTEQVGAAPLKLPLGTYYTPADVADEMVKDALSAAVRDYTPAKVSDAQLLELFSNSDAPAPQLSTAQRRKLTGRIKELRIFDPAVGSGAFLFSVLTALQRALSTLNRLKSKTANPAANPAADIIRRQLAGQDINPLAVQITRLRLFIAIIASRRNIPSNEPLPNLEARIVCADTLETVANSEWRPDRLGQLGTDDQELITALTDVAENRAQWFSAHTEEAKQKLLARDEDLRAQLKILLQQLGGLASPELIEFADSPLYSTKPAPAGTDTRLLFYENPWRGFDIVIGNPPYTDISQAARKSLADGKHYRTTNVGDTYSLFCETALALANPQGGVITMIVPLSIAFGQRQRSLRGVFNGQCREIALRHYDNRPDTTFNASPTVKHQENRQRATVFTAILGKKPGQDIIVKSSGLQRWPAAQRAECLAQRGTTVVPKLGHGVDNRVAGQWLRVPTPEVARLVEAISSQDRTVMSYAYKGDDTDTSGGVYLAFPQTAYQFIGVIPAGTVSPRRETAIRVKDLDDLRLLMVVLNGHVGYAWWWVVGDGFHVKPIADHGTLVIPNYCSKNPGEAIELGQRLIDAIPECIVVANQQGNSWHNVNFHLKPDLIAEIDRFHLKALGLEEEPLLTHLRIMRSSSSWNFAGPA